MPDSLGNANNWGFELGYHDQPIVGAIAWTTAGWAGHVAIVEQIQGDQVQVSEMNVEGLGVVDYRWVPISDFSYIYA